VAAQPAAGDLQAHSRGMQQGQSDTCAFPHVQSNSTD
jgi:hypothetical protein